MQKQIPPGSIDVIAFDADDTLWDCQSHFADVERRYCGLLSEYGDADTIAGETAKALARLFDVTLVYCFEKRGVLRDENDDNSVIPQITRADFEQLVADGVVQGGMIPKLENAFEALRAGVSQVIITQASAINTPGEGTRIVR